MSHHRGLHCDAYLIDSNRSARPLILDPATPMEPVIETVLDRVLAMSRSLYAVRERTFGLFCAERCAQFVLAPAYPIYASIFSSLREVLEEFGTVRRGPNERLDANRLAPFIAYVDGHVSFLDGPVTRKWARIAHRRGIPILASAWAHGRIDDIYVDDMPATEYLAAPEEVTLDLDVTDELPPEELERLLREHRNEN